MLFKYFRKDYKLCICTLCDKKCTFTKDELDNISFNLSDCDFTIKISNIMDYLNHLAMNNKHIEFWNHLQTNYIPLVLKNFKLIATQLSSEELKSKFSELIDETFINENLFSIIFGDKETKRFSDGTPDDISAFYDLKPFFIEKIYEYKSPREIIESLSLETCYQRIELLTIITA